MKVFHQQTATGKKRIGVFYGAAHMPDFEKRLTSDFGLKRKTVTWQTAIHPKQIPILNGVFTPDAAAISHAKRILRAFAEADTGLVVVDGKLIEKPVLREMHRILSIAERVSP